MEEYDNKADIIDDILISFYDHDEYSLNDLYLVAEMMYDKMISLNKEGKLSSIDKI